MVGSGFWGTNKKSHFAKWAKGWTNAGGFTGQFTIECAWKRAVAIKDGGVSWEALGRLMASEQAFGRNEENKSWNEALGD